MHDQPSQRSLQLAPHELGQLQRLVQAHRTPQAIAHRAHLIEMWHTHPDWNTKQMAHALHHHESWVRKWQRRWNETRMLTDAPRSGAPRRFSSEMRAQVTALACSLPRSHGIALTHWSRAELARHAATVPTLPEISPRTIGRWLGEEQIRPWRLHSWQHVQDPERFLQRARPVLRLYEHARSLLAQWCAAEADLWEEPRLCSLSKGSRAAGCSRTRRCSSGKPACPYELRLIHFSLLLNPFTIPLLHDAVPTNCATCATFCIVFQHQGSSNLVMRSSTR
jgi:transposase